MAERLGNLGYLSIIQETVKGTPKIPNVFVPLFKETLSVNGNLQAQQPIFGNKFATYASLQGLRDHQGDLTVMAEPNTLKLFNDNLLTKLSATGTAPQTATFGLSTASDPPSYTYDISLGGIVKRFWGVQLSSFSPEWNDNELQVKLKAAALGSFQARTVASITTTTVVLDTKYDPNPTLGLLVGDLISIYNPTTKASLDLSVLTITNGTTFTVSATAAAFSAGAIVVLRPSTPSFALLDTFLWAKTVFGFGANAASALTNATYALQTRVEQGSTWELLHPFESDAGSKRSGGFDPAALLRLAGDANVSIKKFMDTPEDVQQFNDLQKGALVIRHFAGATNQYEFRITFNNLKVDTPSGNLSYNEITYQNINLLVNYDPTDGQAFSTTVISNTIV